MEGLGSALRKLVDALDSGVQKHYEKRGSSFRPRFYPVAQLLLAHQTCSIRELADFTGLSHSALSQTIKEMKASGLVTSKPGADARERMIELTGLGQTTCEQLQPLWAAVRQAAAALDDELSSPLSHLVEEALLRLSQRDYATRIGDSFKEENS
jgi:DNA-binding MarR family transcriptional regulator